MDRVDALLGRVAGNRITIKFWLTRKERRMGFVDNLMKVWSGSAQCGDIGILLPFSLVSGNGNFDVLYRWIFYMSSQTKVSL